MPHNPYLIFEAHFDEKYGRRNTLTTYDTRADAAGTNLHIEGWSTLGQCPQAFPAANSGMPRMDSMDIPRHFLQPTLALLCCALQCARS